MIPQNGTALPRRPAAHDREDVVVARLERLGTALDGEPDPAFRAATRARLVAMAAVRTPAPEPVSRLRLLLSARADDVAPARWRSRLTAGLAGAAMTVTALAALAAVASNARPGDLLYGLKRGTEQTQLALTADSTRGQTLLDFASTRLDELGALVKDGTTAAPISGGTNGTGLDVVAAGASSDLVLQTIHTMNAETTDGAAWLDGRSVSTADAAPLDRLTAWAAGQKSGLAALQPAMPTAAAPALNHSLDLLAAVSSRATALRTSLDCASAPAVAGTDALGPVPAPCVVPPPSAGSTTGSSSAAPNVAGATPTTPTPGAGSTPVGGTGTTGAGGSGGGSGGGPGTGTGSGTGGVLPTIPSTGGILPTLPKVSIPVPGQSSPASGTSSSSPGLRICIGLVKVNC